MTLQTNTVMVSITLAEEECESLCAPSGKCSSFPSSSSEKDSMGPQGVHKAKFKTTESHPKKMFPLSFL